MTLTRILGPISKRGDTAVSLDTKRWVQAGTAEVSSLLLVWVCPTPPPLIPFSSPTQHTAQRPELTLYSEADIHFPQPHRVLCLAEVIAFIITVGAVLDGETGNAALLHDVMSLASLDLCFWTATAPKPSDFCWRVALCHSACEGHITAHKARLQGLCLQRRDRCMVRKEHEQGGVWWQLSGAHIQAHTHKQTHRAQYEVPMYETERNHWIHKRLATTTKFTYVV